MPFYHKLGQIPHKRHTQFRKPDGQLYREELMGLEGFSSIQSILYHHFLPPRVKTTEDLGPTKPEYVDFGPLRHRALKTDQADLGPDPVSARIPLLGNNDVILGISRAKDSMDYFYRNSQAYETWWVHEGSGTLKSQFGNLPFHKGDYIVIPFGVTWMMELDEEGRFFTIENPSQIEPPKRYRNNYGQLLEHSPYCERDIRVPEVLETHTERGEFEVRVKVRDRLTRHVLDYHPFDVIGWDGCLYPWIFNIGDFEPITGRLHMPPPTHQTFDGHNFVVCSFVPRLFDYHPDGIPAPYNHSNIQSDEVLYYAEGNFMSRKGIDRCDISLHPFGLPHGPQPGMTEASIGKTETKELAVMVDTFHPLQLTKQALQLEKPEYMSTWMEGWGMKELLPFLRHLMGLRDTHALSHSEHVHNLAARLGQKIDLPEERLEKLKFAAEVHDIGKVAVNDFLLTKPGRFTDTEHLMIQQHTVIGARMIKAMPIDGDFISQIILHHHENFDGSGYPNKIKGEDIPLEARILRITDTYDALTTYRGYRAAYSHKEAVGIMESEHHYFDPNLLNIFFPMLPGG